MQKQIKKTFWQYWLRENVILLEVPPNFQNLINLNLCRNSLQRLEKRGRTTAHFVGLELTCYKTPLRSERDWKIYRSVSSWKI